MATEAQNKANRENAQASTGPKTEAGKAKSARNNEKFGLFATDNCIQPGEEEIYANFCDTLWTELAPFGGIEEITAAEYVRNAWRLRRCATTEARLGSWANIIQTYDNKKSGKDRPMGDPVIYAECLPAQNSVDRARAQAQNGMRRAKADLDKIQAERRSRPEIQQSAAEPVVQIEPNIETVPAETTQIEPKSDRVVPENQPKTATATVEFNPLTENRPSQEVNTAPSELKLAA
jgi:hypothetical protein